MGASAPLRGRSDQKQDCVIEQSLTSSKSCEASFLFLSQALACTRHKARPHTAAPEDVPGLYGVFHFMSRSYCACIGQANSTFCWLLAPAYVHCIRWCKCHPLSAIICCCLSFVNKSIACDDIYCLWYIVACLLLHVNCTHCRCLLSVVYC